MQYLLNLGIQSFTANQSSLPCRPNAISLVCDVVLHVWTANVNVKILDQIAWKNHRLDTKTEVIRLCMYNYLL